MKIEMGGINITKKLKIYTLGPPNPCTKCKKTRKNLEATIEKMGKTLGDIEYSHLDIKSKEVVEKYGILQGPAVIANDIVISQGHVPTKKKLEDGLKKVMEMAK